MRHAIGKEGGVNAMPVIIDLERGVYTCLHKRWSVR
jgi:hypothetical protein